MKPTPLQNKILQQQAEGRKRVALHLDPEVVNLDQILPLLPTLNSELISCLLIGGGPIIGDGLPFLIEKLKAITPIPIALLPAGNLQIDYQADAIFLLSLISGRNPDLLIGQHIVAAPLLKRSGLEIISTGHILVESGLPTSTSYFSNTIPLPKNNLPIATSTALAGEMLGLRICYLDAGWGAKNPVPPKIIRGIRKAIFSPIFVAGAMHKIDRIKEAFNAGADVVVLNYNSSADAELFRVVEKFLIA